MIRAIGSPPVPAALLPALPDHALLVLWTELAALLVLARLLGTLARRLRQPAVLGELVAGLVLGPSVLGELRCARGPGAARHPEPLASAMVRHRHPYSNLDDVRRRLLGLNRSEDRPE